MKHLEPKLCLIIHNLITAIAGGKVTLQNLTLSNAPKYGIQAYDGGTVVLDGVTINNCGFGGVLINGGTVTVKNLSLGFNGASANNGIEMDKGSAVSITPTLIMQGKLSTNQNTNIVRILSSAKVKNASSTSNKIFVSANKIVLTDSNNIIVAEGAIEGGSVNAEVQKVILTIVSNNKKTKVILDTNSKISKSLLGSSITLLEGQVVEGYYTDDTYTTEFDFDTLLTADTTVYAKISTATTSKKDPTTTPEEHPTTNEAAEGKGEKDETPKTGITSYVGVVGLIAIVSTVGIIYLKRKNA